MTGLPADTRTMLARRWQLDSMGAEPGVLTFRPESAQDVPGRPRFGLSLNPDASAELTGPDMEDRPRASTATWDVAEGPSLQIALADGGRREFDIVELRADLLQLRERHTG